MIERVVVVVPARDEQDLIGACLSSLLLACERLSVDTAGRVHGDVVVVLDGCRDRTAEIVAAHGVRAVRTDVGCVGAARRLGVQAALASLDGRCAPEAIWIANTDADCQVPPDWLVRMVAGADAGADLMLGTVSPGTGLPAAIEALWSAGYQLGPGHPHVHGANLGVRVSAYEAVGGWRDLACHEDHDLVERAMAAGRPILRSGEHPVRTSSRLVNRVVGGFAGYLRDLHARPAGTASPEVTASAPLGT